MTIVYQGKSAQNVENKTNSLTSTGIKAFAIVLCSLLGWMTFAFGTQLLRHAEIGQFTNQLTRIVQVENLTGSVTESSTVSSEPKSPNHFGSQSLPNQSSESFHIQTASLRTESRVR